MRVYLRIMPRRERPAERLGRRRRERHRRRHDGARARPPRGRRARARARRAAAARGGELVAARGVRRAALQAAGRDLAGRRRAVVRARRPLRGRRQLEGLRRQPAALPRERLRGGRAPRGHVARLAVRLRRPRALLPGGGGALPGARHDGRGSDRAAPQRGLSRSRPCRTSRTSPTLAERLRAQGVRPASNSMGIDLRPGGACIRCSTCDGFPCLVDAKSDAETCGIDPALATGNARLVTGARVTRLVADAQRPPRRRAARRGARGPGHGHRRPLRARGRRGQLRGAAAGLGRRAPSARPGQRLRPGRPQLHDAQQRAHRGRRRRPRQRRARSPRRCRSTTGTTTAATATRSASCS